MAHSRKLFDPYPFVVSRACPELVEGNHERILIENSTADGSTRDHSFMRRNANHGKLRTISAINPHQRGS